MWNYYFLFMKLLLPVYETITSCIWNYYFLYMKLLLPVYETIISCIWNYYLLYMKLLLPVYETISICIWITIFRGDGDISLLVFFFSQIMHQNWTKPHSGIASRCRSTWDIQLSITFYALCRVILRYMFSVKKLSLFHMPFKVIWDQVSYYFMRIREYNQHFIYSYI